MGIIWYVLLIMGTAGFILSTVFSLVVPVWILFYEELSDATKGQPRKLTAEAQEVGHPRASLLKSKV